MASLVRREVAQHPVERPIQEITRNEYVTNHQKCTPCFHQKCTTW